MSFQLSQATGSSVCGGASRKVKLGKKMVTIYVGPDDEPFVIHRNLITISSDFFAKAMGGSFQEKEGTIRLPLYTSDLFENYMQWLYEGPLSLPRLEGKKGGTVPKGRFELFFALYELGTFIQDRCFQNTIIDAFIDHVLLSNKYPIHLPAAACQQLPMSSSLCRLLVDFYAYGCTEAWYDSAKARTAPKEFWIEVGRTSAGLLHNKIDARKSRPWIVDRCRYHEHSEGEGKCGAAFVNS
ncbi:hypothetical protein FKW77_000477 [Venturia effusa]|uniref:BTB domain-containing protein n=1 Tax=Venturia effusa TaxID=50376 RepID=A0A517LA87_9PEZI|nr:hypothetical protein FKW77_000477 [Venturia effusa]